MQSIRKRSFKRISTAVLAILLVLALLPATADARVNPFKEAPSGGGGTGGGVNEAFPRGFGIDLNGKEPGGLTWLSSQYDNHNWCAIFTGITNGHQEKIPVVDENGDPIIYYMNAYVDRNPGNIAGNTAENPEPFIILYKDGERVSLAGNIVDNGAEVQKVGAPIRGGADRAGNTFDPSGQGPGGFPGTVNRWTVPMTLTFEPGHTYEFAFAQGFICNNGVVNMISEDGTGYYQRISDDPADPERIYYEANKYKESQYREYLYQTYIPNTPPEKPGQTAVYMDEAHKNPTVGTMHPMRFTLKTEPIIPVTSVSLSKTETVIPEGSTEKLNATLAPEDATVKKVLWSSSDENVATVGEDGTVTAVSPGKATITATSKNGGFTAECAVTVPGFVLTSTVTSLFVGDTATVAADYFGPETDLVWSSSNSAIASVGNPTNATVKSADKKTTAEITGNSVGTATIAVETKDGKLVKTFQVKVNPVAVTGVSLDKADATVPMGSTEVLKATVSPANATDKTVKWTSSDEKVATVAADGTVKAIAPGKATITATTTDGEFTDQCNVTVPGLVLTSTVDSLFVGETSSASADYFGPETDLVWSSGNSAVASVGNPTNASVKSADKQTTAEITGNSVGTATIFIATKDGKIINSFQVKVNPVAVTGVSLDKADATVPVGSTEELKATVTPENAENKGVTWSSSDEKVATVAADGTVTAIAPGKATITVTTKDGGHTDECVITVPGLLITSKITKMKVGDTATATADYFGPETQLFWTSSDKKVVDITKPTNAGVRSADIATTAQLTAKGVGTATISVETADGEMVAEFQVTVEPKAITPKPPVDTTPDGGTTKPGAAGTVTKTATKGTTPKTGDNSLMASGLMLLVAAGATGAGALRR
ncbi:MAG: Ig-like domain-containing protein, partial [Anaerovoracaceae bacterium]